MTVERPLTDAVADLHDLPVADALEACEARGLVPTGWTTDPLRGWHCAPGEVDTSSGSRVAAQPARTADLLAVVALGCGLAPREVDCAACVSVTLKPGTNVRVRAQNRPCAACGSTGTHHLPRGHDRAEELARRVVADLRAYGHPAASPARVRVVWRVTDAPPGVEEAWRREGVRLFADGRVIGPRVFDLVPSVRALAPLGVHLGRVTDDAVTLVAPRPERF